MKNMDMEEKLKKISKENLQKIILEMSVFFTEEQQLKLNALISEHSEKKKDGCQDAGEHRMSQIFVDEKLEQMKGWMKQLA